MRKSKALIFAFIAATIAVMAQTMPKNMKKLLNAQYAITTYYVDSVNEEQAVEDAIRGILSKLDPHSEYTTAQETKALNEPLQGSFSGIGIQFNMNEDTLYVIQTIAGGPSEKVGIQAGDRIIAINDTSVAGQKLLSSDIQKRLRGPKDTKVDVTVKRHRQPQPIHFRITRDNIPLYSIDASYMLNHNTGYVKIARFAATTNTEFVAAIDSLKRLGMQQLVLDLCDNGGGYLNSAIEMANEFLGKGQGIVYTEGRNAPRNDAKALGTGHFKKGRVAVLVNQYSASSSEILTGALQDWDRAIVVGRRTFGKGLVQRPFQFEDGSMIRLTVSRYYTPSGRCIQKPYEKGKKDDYAMDILNRYKDGELSNADSTHHVPDSLRYNTLLNRRTIYGGGGITPDFFVPLDTTQYSDFYRDIVAKGTLTQFCISYVDQHRHALRQQYPTMQDFDNGFTVNDTIETALISAAHNDSIKYVEPQYRKSAALIRQIAKAVIARDLYTDPSAYFVVMNHNNDILQQALTVLNDERRYRQTLGEKLKK